MGDEADMGDGVEMTIKDPIGEIDVRISNGTSRRYASKKDISYSKVGENSSWHDYHGLILGSLSKRNVKKEIEALRRSPDDKVEEKKRNFRNGYLRIVYDKKGN
jgi:hypothetical protein